MNKIVVVIGASRGIGKEVVLKFAENPNYTILALSRNEEEMKRNFTLPNIHFFPFDLQSENLVESLQKILNPYPKIDVLINNAGLLIKKPLLKLSKKDLLDSYQTNAIGPILATQVVVPKMLENGGHIVNISTMGAVQGSVKFPELIAYSSSKTGIVGFTELFAEEFKETKINMNALCLGSVQTKMLAEAFPGLHAKISAKEMAKFIVDFALHSAPFFNGKIIPVSSSTP